MRCLVPNYQETSKKDDKKIKSDKSSPLPFKKTTETLKKLIKEERHEARLVPFSSSVCKFPRF